MSAIIYRLVSAVWKAIKLLAQFLAILLLGMLAALLFALPWVLRLASLLVWLLGGFLVIQVVQHVYGANTPASPILALQFAVIFLMVAWIGVLFKKAPLFTWGGLLLGGLLSGWIAWQGVPMMMARWQYADLFLRSLPPALLALTMFFMTLRLRFLRSAQQLKLVNPAFLWLPKAVHLAKDYFTTRKP